MIGNTLNLKLSQNSDDLSSNNNNSAYGITGQNGSPGRKRGERVSKAERRQEKLDSLKPQLKKIDNFFQHASINRNG